jgi:hypothetical protein
MQLRTLVFNEFDTQAFGFQFYRLKTVDGPALREDLAALSRHGPFAADGKLPADDRNGCRTLLICGFRKVCMQVTLAHDLQNVLPTVPDSQVSVVNCLSLSEETLLAHARNFTVDRFSLDPLLPAEGHDRLYAQWFKNSLSGAKQTAHCRHNVCTFGERDGELVIDLVSILDQRQGIGTRILNTILSYAKARALRRVRVTTECENTGAWSLYQRLGFLPISYSACYHYVHTGA